MGCGSVIIRFMGLRELEQKSSGCCGRRRVSEYVIKREKRMVLPSGRIVTFRIGETEDVSEEDGKFLLSLNTRTMSSFLEV